MIPDFDPYDTLIKCDSQINQIQQNIFEIARAINQRSEALEDIIKTLNHNTLLLNDQQAQLKNLHDRVRLLEAARQHENKD